MPPRLNAPTDIGLSRPPIPIVETVESEILSPLLDPAQMRLESMAHEQTQADSRARSLSEAGSRQAEQEPVDQPDFIPLERDVPEIVITYSSQQALQDTDAAQESLEDNLAADLQDSPPHLDITGSENQAAADSDPMRAIKRLGIRAYRSYREFQITRMRAYRHLRMNPPEAVIPPVRGISKDRVYFVKLDVPGCESCHLAQTILVHGDYVTAFSALPFLCRHGVKVKSMRIEESQRGQQVLLPLELIRVADSTSSASSSASACAERLNEDMALVTSHARSAVDYFCRLEDQAFHQRLKLTDVPEIDAPQLMRMRAIIESEAEDARQDLKQRIDSLADHSVGGGSRVTLSQAPNRSLSWDLTNRLGPQGNQEHVESVRRSVENLSRPDGSTTSSEVLLRPGDRLVVMDGVEGVVVAGSDILQSPEILRGSTRDTRAQAKKKTGGARQSPEDEEGASDTSSARIREDANKVAEALRREQEKRDSEAAKQAAEEERRQMEQVELERRQALEKQKQADAQKKAQEEERSRIEKERQAEAQRKAEEERRRQDRD